MKNISFILLPILTLFIVIGCSSLEKTANAKPTKEAVDTSIETTQVTESKDTKKIEDTRIETLKKAVESYPDSLLVLLSRTPCYGNCPVYILKLYKSGFVTYEGKYNTEMKGFFESTFTKENNATILSKINAINFFDMNTIYDTNVTDFPSVHVYAHIGQKKKQILDRQDGPKELKELEELLDNLISNTKWTKR